MAKRILYRVGDEIGPWTLKRLLGVGGNAEVWAAKDLSGQRSALKVLRDRSARSDAYRRFAAEVDLLRQLDGTEGVLPLYAASIPQLPTRGEPAWYTMPVARQIDKALGRSPSLDVVVNVIANVARVLATLADRDVFHRDLKPNNILQWRGRWCLGDFGLATYPGKQVLTAPGRNFGPSFFKPLEFSSDAAAAAPGPADVFSLAKTLYVLAVGSTWTPH